MVLDPIDYHSMNMEVNGTRNCFCSKISDLQCFYIVQNLRLKLNSCILRSDLDKLLIYKTHPSFWFLHDTCPSFSVIFLLISGRVTLIQGYFDLHCKAELALYKNDSRDISVKNLTNDAVRLRQWSVRSLSVLLWRGCNLYSDFENAPVRTIYHVSRMKEKSAKPAASFIELERASACVKYRDFTLMPLET